MSFEVDAVVIGSGAFGASAAFHLAKLGQKVALLDKFGLGSQTSPRAAGLTQQIRAKPDMTRIAMLSVAKLLRFEEETGQPLAVHQGGSLKMARTARDAEQIRSEVAAGQELGLDIDHIDEADLGRLAPYARPVGVAAMWHTASDLYLDPAQLPAAYVRAAASLGAETRPFTPVTEIVREGGAVAGVVAGGERWHAPVVVDAAGAWARSVAEEAGLKIPIQPVRHQLLITEPIAGVADGQAICRVIDVNVYVRPDGGGLLLGGYEPDPLPLSPAERGPEFQISDLPLDEAVLRRLAASVGETFPALPTAAARLVRGGLPTMTADDRPLVGPVPSLPGFFAITGCCVGGLSASPGLGQLLAEQIVHGAPSLPLDDLAIDRFGGRYDDEVAMREAGLWAYSHHYAVAG